MKKRVKIYVEKINRNKTILIDEDGSLHKTFCGKCNEKGVKTQYVYKNGEVICPVCNNTLTVVKTPEEFESETRAREEKIKQEALENLHIGCAGKDMSTGIEFYSLSARVDNETVWPKIKQYFSYYRAGWSNNGDCDFEMYGFEPSGWLTTEPEKVEAVLIDLGVMKPENTLKARREAEAKARREAEAKKEEEKRLKNEIDSEIMKNVNIEKPKIDNYPHTVEEYGDEVVERHEDPNYRFNCYGGGQEYVICKEHIWKIRNNGSDGANWSLNNIATGGAGAIGVRVPFSVELAEKIREYCKV